MSKLEENAYNLVKALEKAGFLAFFAGGYVRDKIIKRKTNDIDIATDARPEEIKKVLTKNKVKFIEIGEAFGVIAAVIPKNKKENYTYEIATFRQDFGVKDNRHPKNVKFLSDPKEDAVRRDFTINGMFMGLHDNCYIAKSLHCWNMGKQKQCNNATIKQCPILKKEKEGIVVDFVYGLQDINSRIIRFIGNPQDRIEEDALRMMRAVRFACQLGFEIEPESLRAIEKNKGLIKEISEERIRDEITKILISERRREGIDLLEKIGLLHLIIPELDKAKDTPQPKNMHFEGSVWNHTLLALEKCRTNDPIINWAVLLHDVGKSFTFQSADETGDRIRFNGHDSEGAKIAATILRRLKFSNEEVSTIEWMIKFHMLFSNLFKMREARRIMYLSDPRFPKLLELFWVDANSSVRSTPSGRVLPPELSAYNRGKKFLEAHNNKPSLPKPLIRGNVVMKIMGITSGTKEVGEILKKVYDAQLEKKIRTKAEAKKMAEKLLKKK